MTSRRGFLLGAVTSLLAAPAIIRVADLMPLKVFVPPRQRVLLKFGSGRSFISEVRIDPFYIPADAVPPGWVWQWHGSLPRPLGQDFYEMRRRIALGWTPVPGYAPQHGMILMERPAPDLNKETPA